jgi:hypothetical protein
MPSKPPLKFGDVMLRRGVHVMVIDPKPSEKKGNWDSWFAGTPLDSPGASYGLRASREVAFYRLSECKKVEDAP